MYAMCARYDTYSCYVYVEVSRLVKFLPSDVKRARSGVRAQRVHRVKGSKGQRAHFGYTLQERKRGKVERIWGARQETEVGGTL